jgi:hypothetical protein
MMDNNETKTKQEKENESRGETENEWTGPGITHKMERTRWYRRMEKEKPL